MIRCARFAAFGLTLAVLSACGVGVSQSRPPGAVTAYVVNAGSNTVTAFSTLTGRVIKTIKVGGMPLAIAITPDGRTAYVANFGSETVTPINTATQHAGQAIKVADGPVALAITPDGRTVYVLSVTSDAVTPVSTSTQRAGQAIKLGENGLEDGEIAITPDGTTAYVAGDQLTTDGNPATGTVTPVDLATRAVGTPIKVGGMPLAIAITPDGNTAYVTTISGDSSGTVTPIDLVTGIPGRPIDPVKGDTPTAIAISSDGAAIYVTSFLPSDSTVPTDTLGTMTAIRAISGRPGIPVNAGDNPSAIAIMPDGTTAYVVNAFGYDPGTVTPIQIATGTREKSIPVGHRPVAIALSSRTNSGGNR